MEKFDYAKALAELEKIAATSEDPATPLGEIDKLLKRSEELIALCREYLRTARKKLETI